MAWTQAQVDSAKTALASGKLQVRFGDRSITYRSVDELRRAIAIMESEVNAATKTKVIKAYFDGGY